MVPYDAALLVGVRLPTDESLKVILVVGAGGFVAKHFRDIVDEHELVLVQRRARDASNELRPNETIIDADSFDGREGDALIRMASAVIYLRSASVPGTFQDDPSQELSENAQPALRFFTRCARLNPDARIVLTSSGGAVYGADQHTPIAEDQPTLPISSYGYGKLVIEDGLRLLQRTDGVRFSILRLSNPIGRHHVNPRQGLVSAAFQAIRTGRPLPLFGTGNVRDYVDADDVAAALLLAATTPASTSHTLNIGSGRGHSIGDIIATIETTLAMKVPVEIKAPRNVDVPYVVLDCARAEQQLGWKASTPIETTIEKTWRNTPASPPPQLRLRSTTTS